MINLGPVPLLTRPAAAHAIGVNVRTLRGWCESGVLALAATDKRAGAWSRLAPLDVLRLAVLAELLRFGLTVAEAGSVVSEHIDRRLAGVAASVAAIPWHLLRNRLLGLALQISREPHGLAVSAFSIRGDRPAWHTGASLLLNVHGLLADVQARASERDTRHA